MTVWTVAHHTPLSTGFCRQEWSGLPFPFPGDLPDPGIDPKSLALQAVLRQILNCLAAREAHMNKFLPPGQWIFFLLLPTLNELFSTKRSKLLPDPECCYPDIRFGYGTSLAQTLVFHKEVLRFPEEKITRWQTITHSQMSTFLSAFWQQEPTFF